MRLSGKVALVTGAGSGIGRASAILFAQEGASVVAADIDEEPGEETVAAIRGDGGEAVFVKVDVSSSGEVQDMVRSCMDRHAALDVLFNCAAVSLTEVDRPVADLDEEVWNTTIAINLTGTFLCCKYAVPVMVERRMGSIINVISRACYVGNDLHAYSASKSGVLSLTKNIAVSYAAHNVRANAISPGGIDTPMSLQVRNTPETAATYLRGLPLKRLAEPVEVSRLALYLASDESPHVTGAIIPIDAGACAV
ncbi:MAG: SDR family NAD(P)-dependent oxidoreductase [Immundisolibacterales bacterium]|nr:SDR family NAD(P)-dependent oxidoreductase [Immundisolibacterales bacterium]